MKNKLYKCEMPGCTKEVQIRSSIKTEGEFYRLRCCNLCKAKVDRKVKVYKPIPKFTEKSVTKRKNERTGLVSFFAKAILELRDKPYCQNCGCKINVYIHPVNNVAHILKKSYYKSVMDNDLNRVFLCADKDNENNCHEKFDNRIYDRPTMNVFLIAKEKYLLFKDQVKETGNELLIFEENGI